MLLAVLASCHVWLSAVQGPTDTLRIYAVGDINLGRNLGRTVLARGDTLYPFRALADTLRAADLTFGNLESPIVAGTRQVGTPGGGFTAPRPPAASPARARLTMVTTPHNHPPAGRGASAEEAPRRLPPAPG